MYRRLSLCCLIALVGCSRNSAQRPVKEASRSVEAEDGGEIRGAARDSLGREVRLGDNPKRIVSLSPAGTELLFAIGAGPRVVGVTTFCDHPPAAQELEKVGGFTSESLSIEKVVSLRPDLVISAGNIHRTVIAQLERLDVRVAALDAESFGDLYKVIELLGRLTGNEKQAAELVGSIERRVTKVESVAQTIPGDQRRTVFYQVWDDPLLAAGPGSFIGRLIELSGGVNIVSDTTAAYPHINLEVIVTRDPQVVLVPSHHGGEEPLDALLSKASWSGVRAVRDRNVKSIDGDCVSRFGPRIVDALEQIAAAIYPERYRDQSPRNGDEASPASRETEGEESSQ